MNTYFYAFLFSLTAFFAQTNRATARNGTNPVPDGGNISFVENKGQWDTRALYRADIPGGAIFLTSNGFVYNFIRTEDLHNCSRDGLEHTHTDSLIHGHAYKVNFLGANATASRQEFNKRNYYHNYFIGNIRSQWASGVSLFGEVRYNNIYNGTDMRVYSESDQSVKYDFIVKAGNDPAQIAMSFEGVTPQVDKEGNLVIQTSVNTIVERAPYTYQVINNQKQEVKSRYKLNKGILSFDFPEGYNTAYDLVIDPILIFASFSGATGSRPFYAHSTTFDLLGNTYSAALGDGPNWPTTTGAYQTTFAGIQTASIMKINSTGTNIVYATYFGANGGYLEPNTLRVNNKNELFIAGSSTARNMPLSDSAYQREMKGPSDIYVAHFSEDGKNLLGCTFVGGTSIESSLPGQSSVHSGLGSGPNPVEIAFDKNGSVWVTSNTNSTDFPVTANAAQDKLAGSHDAVIFNLSADCSHLLYSTYFGGSEWDGGISIEIDNGNEHVAIAGWTTSPGLPNTAGTLNSAGKGNSDAFVAKLNKSTFKITTATFLGTANADYAQCIAFDKKNNIYVAGRSVGGQYPITPGVYSLSTGNIFLQKLDPDLRTSMASTRIASSSSNVQPSAMIVDVCDNVLLATIGSVQNGLPVTEDAFDATARPFWFCALKPDFADLYFGSYFGSGSDHFHTGVARMDPNGIIYHSVCASGAPDEIKFPTTSNSFAPKKLNANTNDNITFKFNFEATGVQSNFVLDPAVAVKDTGCAPYFVAFKNTSSTAKDYVWDFGDGTPTTTQTSPSHTYVNPGKYTVTLYANNDTSCVTADTSYMDIVVLYVEKPEIETFDTILCHYEQKIDIRVEIKNPGPNTAIQWSPATGILSDPDTTTITVDPSANHIYYVAVKDTIAGICALTTIDSVFIDLSPRELRILTNDTVVCEGDAIPIVARSTPGYTYRWIPSTGVSDSTALEPEITILQPEVYTLTASYPGCLDTTVSIVFNMHYVPRVNVGPDIAVCQGTEVALESKVSPFRDDYSYLWLPDTGLNNPDGPNADLIADSTGTYFLKVTTPIGCSSGDSIRILVYPGGFGSASNDTAVCPQNTVTIWADGGTRYAWTPAYGLSDTTVAQPLAAPQTPTQYTVYITDHHNCVDTEYVFVQIYPEATLALPDSVTVYPGEQYEMSPNSNCTYFQWFPPSGLNNTEIANPLASPEVRTRYFVNARTEFGCDLTDSIDILVAETIIDMPNAFSPAGINNTFKPAKRGIAQLKSFAIYNRWGVKVFQTTQIEEGWDGTYKGKPQPLGSYIYIIEAVTNTGKEIVKQGNVTLIK